MSCPDEGQLVRLISGDLTPNTAAALERHIRECRGCAIVVAELRATWKVLGEWDEGEATADLWPVVRAALESETKRRAGWLPGSTGGALRAAASIAIAVGLGWATGSSIGPSEPAPTEDSGTSSVEAVMGPLGLDEFITSSATGLQLMFEASEENGQEEVL